MAANCEVFPTPAHRGTQTGTVEIRHWDSQPVGESCGSPTHEEYLPDSAFQVTTGHYLAAHAASAWAHMSDQRTSTTTHIALTGHWDRLN
ncbi:Hypothetical predicted protein [Pelobates cultripes]|uniref:Uncharacterized protein n=1 Tax=Pelobates cultripes TaxID=61616 RepID=A0AAD1SC89_PELCU|nr:Hypothetical predicted protein [Pelobates cultripes]